MGHLTLGAHSPIWAHIPKMVFGHNLALVAPFEILLVGNCVKFRCAYFFEKSKCMIFSILGPWPGPRAQAQWPIGPRANKNMK